MEAGTAVARGSRPTIGRLPRVRRQDAAFKYALLTVAGLILALIAFFFIRLYVEANPAFQKFGLFGFGFTNNWDVSREVMATVPPDHKEAALALGATRWEMIRTAVLPYSRAGISGAAMLGLGRAIGETIAVTLVIGNAPTIGKQLFDQGYTLAAVIANEFGEAANDPTHRAALIAAGLVLFVLTLIVNAAARYMVHRASRGTRAGGGEAAAIG